MTQPWALSSFNLVEFALLIPVCLVEPSLKDGIDWSSPWPKGSAGGVCGLGALPLGGFLTDKIPIHIPQGAAQEELRYGYCQFRVCSLRVICF